MVKLEKIEDSPQAQSEGIQDHNQTGSVVWERMLGDEGDQQEEACYHGDDDASRDHLSVETRSHAKRRHSTHITACTDRRGYAQWPSSLVWTCPETRCRQRHCRVMEPVIPGTRRRGRPKKTCTNRSRMT